MCSKVFSTKDSLLNHEESVHTENVPLLEDSKCKLSKETDQNPSELRALRCKDCKLKFSSEDLCTEHMKQHERQEDDLPKVLDDHDNNDSLSTHIECEHCHEGFADEQFLKSHMESNCEKIKHKVDENRSVEEDLNTHIETVHIEEKPSDCKPKKTIESPVIAENEAIPQVLDNLSTNCEHDNNNSINVSDDCEKNNNTPKKSENNNENPQIQVEEGIQLTDIDWSKVEFIYKPVIVDQNPEALDMSDVSIQK